MSKNTRTPQKPIEGDTPLTPRERIEVAMESGNYLYALNLCANLLKTDEDDLSLVDLYVEIAIKAKAFVAAKSLVTQIQAGLLVDNEDTEGTTEFLNSLEIKILNAQGQDSLNQISGNGIKQAVFFLPPNPVTTAPLTFNFTAPIKESNNNAAPVKASIPVTTQAPIVPQFTSFAKKMLGNAHLPELFGINNAKTTSSSLKPESKKSIDAYISQAIQNMDQGNGPGAIRALKNALIDYPGNKDLEALLGGMEKNSSSIVAKFAASSEAVKASEVSAAAPVKKRSSLKNQLQLKIRSL
jgi:hypothetical protein